MQLLAPCMMSARNGRICPLNCIMKNEYSKQIQGKGRTDMKAITEILENIFSACEYQVNKSHDFDLIIEKDRVQTIIKIGMPSLDEILAFAKIQTNENKLYITPESVPETYKKLAQDNNVCVWDREILETTIGKVILADAQGNYKEIKLPISITCKTHKEDAKSDFTLLKHILSTRGATKVEIKDESPTHIIPSISPVVPLQQPTEQSKEQPEVKIDTLYLNTTPLKLNKAEAISIGRKEVSKPKEAALFFIPFWSYRYSFEIEKKFKSKVINLSADEYGVVNAVNGLIEKWDIAEVLSEIEVPCEYEIKRQSVS